MSDTTKRSLAKTVSWRITGSTSTFAISYALSGSFAMASSIALTQMAVATVLYYIHERVWDSVKWGRRT